MPLSFGHFITAEEDLQIEKILFLSEVHAMFKFIKLPYNHDYCAAMNLYNINGLLAVTVLQGQRAYKQSIHCLLVC